MAEMALTKGASVVAERRSRRLHPRNIHFVALSSRSCPLLSRDSSLLTSGKHSPSKGGTALTILYLQVRIPNDGWGRDLMGVLTVRTEEIGTGISRISRQFHECPLQPISSDQSG